MGSTRGYVVPPRYWAWLGRPGVLLAGCWLVALGVGVHHLRHARAWLVAGPDTPTALRRPDPAGHGHTQVDFGGQWVMARMLVTGRGRELYHRQRQWEVVRAGFPVADETPAQREESIVPATRRELARSSDDVGHDADRMMGWFMGGDPPAWKTVGGAAAAPLAAAFADPFTAVALEAAAAAAVTPAVVAAVETPAVGGPLYPPVHAFFYAPLGLFPRPHDAYALFQVVALGAAALAGLGISRLTGGRVWWPVATVAVLLYPGCRSALELGQNPTFSLCVLVWGWVLAARGRDAAGGMVWGLLAFKPVWGLAFFLVPLLTRRWRFCAAMVGTGAGLAAATLPVVGVQAWLDWLDIGKQAAGVYNQSTNWIALSRDLQGLPRRYLLDLSPQTVEDTPLARRWGWGLWGFVFGATVLTYALRGDRRRAVGLGAGFLFLGAFLTCYRFMYYDVLLSAVAVAVLLAEPGRLLRTRTFTLSDPTTPALDREMTSPAAVADPLGPRAVGYVNSFALTVLLALYLHDNVLLGLNARATLGLGGSADTPLSLDTSLTYPWDTALLLVLWAGSGLRLLARGERSS